MLYLVMCKDKIHKKRHDILIRIFLTCCSRFCKEYYDGSVKEFWSNKQNFPSLLNFPDQIEKFGAVGLSWDATFEACLPGIKSILKSARKNAESLLPRMVLLQKKCHISDLRERLVWHKKRQASAGCDNLDAPNVKRQRTDGGRCAADHRMNTDLIDDDESGRYDLRVYTKKDEILDRFNKGMFLCGFTVPYEKSLMMVPFSCSKTEADCVTFWIDRRQMRESDSSKRLQYVPFRHVQIPNMQAKFGKKKVFQRASSA